MEIPKLTEEEKKLFEEYSKLSEEELLIKLGEAVMKDEKLKAKIKQGHYPDDYKPSPEEE
jgi:hypothetical protein